MAAQLDGIRRWICPTDRELKLRSKLNSGWSVRSQDHLQKAEPILESELRAIERVMERAKEVNATEKERIRKMLCRLENMKRSSIGDGKNTCSMCGVASAWFGSTFIRCSDCSNAVCEKCRIDIHSTFEECVLCKLCSEYREVWKKSGGWFYGALPRIEKMNCNELKCYPTSSSDTWNHRARDIVRMESFEAPEQTRNNLFYKTWAVNSVPDFNSLEDEMILKKFKKNKFRKCSEGAGLVKQMMTVPTLNNSKISASCPSLQRMPIEESSFSKKKNKKAVSKRFLKPAQKMMEKLMKHAKIKYSKPTITEKMT